jgi:hypothetical protein
MSAQLAGHRFPLLVRQPQELGQERQVVVPGKDTDAFHDNIAGEINALTEVTPASGDWLVIEDATNSNNKRKVDASNFLSSGTVIIAIGTYTGDGSGGNRAITGLGFQPDTVWIHRKENGNYMGFKTDQDTTFAHLNGGNVGQLLYVESQIISLDADGFTVGTGSTQFNVSTKNYVYVAWRA